MGELAKIQTAVPAPAAPLDITALQALGGVFVKSGYFQDTRDTAQAIVKVLAGQELGIPPIAAMMGVNIIKGKVALGARLIASRVMAHGYSFKVRYLENDGAEIEFFGKDKSSLGVSSFKRADAEAAGLLGDMYKKYARNMYYARAMSNGANWYTPDVFGGAPVYTPEELGAHVDGEGEIISAPAETPGQVLSRRLTEERGNLAKLEATEELPAKPWTTFKGMLELFATAKAAVGDAQYYRCLHAHGVEHANEFKGKGVAAAMACYTELLDLAETLGNVETEPA